MSGVDSEQRVLERKSLGRVVLVVGQWHGGD